MKQVLSTVAATLLLLPAISQQNYFSASAFTTQNAMPFGKFSNLFSEIYHPGIELGYGKIILPKAKHEWYLELKFAYFFHRYVQHGIPLYLDFGYRYKISSRISAETSIGAGYMHSIPAIAKLKLGDNGEYKNNKGVGRMQVTATYGLGLSFVLNRSAAKTLRIFTNYQQRLQMPFIKSYVPLLPYNSFMIGLRKPLQK